MRTSVFSQGRGRASFREAKRSVCAACRADGAFRRRRNAPRARGDRRRGGDQGILRSKMAGAPSGGGRLFLAQLVRIPHVSAAFSILDSFFTLANAAVRTWFFIRTCGRASFREAKRSVCAACRADGAFRRRRNAPRARGDRRRGGDQGILRSKMAGAPSGGGRLFLAQLVRIPHVSAAFSILDSFFTLANAAVRTWFFICTCARRRSFRCGGRAVLRTARPTFVCGFAAYKRRAHPKKKKAAALTP